MASNTEFLKLLKKDPVADANDTFNIRTMLNENWDKIDLAYAMRARVVLGTYIGTGVYGADNPNVIELGFKPKLVIINKSFSTPNGGGYNSSVRNSISIFYGNGQNQCECAPGASNTAWRDNVWTVTVTETGLSWYYTLGTVNGVDSANTAAVQLNNSGTEYTYIAIG